MARSTHKVDLWQEGLITALAVGGFFVILGVTFGLMPGVWSAVVDFFSDLTGVTYPLGTGSLVLPAPDHPANHMIVYSAAFNFMVGIAVLQVAILALRLGVHSQISKVAETVGNLVFWGALAVVANMFLFAGTQNGWFTFWATVIILAGVSLVIQFVIRLAAWHTGHRN